MKNIYIKGVSDEIKKLYFCITPVLTEGLRSTLAVSRLGGVIYNK